MENQKGDRKKGDRVVPEGLESSVQSRIARRAYELYLERGGVLGHEMEDWLQAEREIMSRQNQ